MEEVRKLGDMADEMELDLDEVQADLRGAVGRMGELDEGLANLTQRVAPPSPPRALTRQDATAGRPQVGGKGVKRPYVAPRRRPKHSRVVIDEDNEEAFVPDLASFFQQFDISTQQEINICAAYARCGRAMLRAAQQDE